MVQLQALNKILKDKDISLITSNNLDVSFFSDYKSEYTFIKTHYDKYGVVPDTTTFLSNFPNFQIVNVDESIDYIVDELYKDKNTRDLAYAFNQIRDLIVEGKTEQALTLFKTSSEKITTNKNINAISIFEDTSRYDKYIEKTKDFAKFYISTGLPELDNLIVGWDRQEELATLIAKSGIGKTWLMLFFASASARQGLRVGIYSGEMSVDKVGYRIDTLLGHISNGSLLHGNDNIKLEYKNYIDNIRNNVSGDIFVITPYNINGSPTVSTLRAFIEQYNLDILFVDQHSLLEDERRGRSQQEKAYNISKDIRILQNLIKKPVICVSQMNREKNESDPDSISLDQIANSSGIGNDSTLVLGISRDKNDHNIIKIQIVKSRDTGEVGKTLTYYADLNLGTLKYIPEGNESVEMSNVNYETRYETAGGDVF